jgi:hypothetical protein
MLPRVFSVMVTQRRSGFESRNIRFEGPSSNMYHRGTIALCSTEADYVATTEGVRDALWLPTLLAELGFRVSGRPEPPSFIFVT